MITPAQADAEERTHPEPRPPLGSWTFLYVAVIVIQVLLVIAFVLFQNAYA